MRPFDTLKVDRSFIRGFYFSKPIAEGSLPRSCASIWLRRINNGTWLEETNDAVAQGDNMNAMKILGIVLIVGGILGLMYGSFTYTKETHEAKVGPLVLSIADKETVNVPIWVGVGAIVIGGLLLVFGNRRS